MFSLEVVFLSSAWKEMQKKIKLYFLQNTERSKNHYHLQIRNKDLTLSSARIVASSLLSPKNNSAPLLQRSYYLSLPQNSVTTHKAD